MATATQRLVERWNGFWFAEGSPRNLAIFRILFAGVLLVELRTSHARNLCSAGGSFRLPYTELIPPLPPALYDGFHQAQVPLLILLALGVAPRLACVGLLGLQSTLFFCDQLNFRNHPYFFMLVLLLLALSPCGEALSLRSWYRRRGGLARAPLGAQRLIQVQVSLVYFYAAIHKLNADYLTGHVLSFYFGRDLLRGFSQRVLEALFAPGTLDRMQAFVDSPENLAPLAWASVATEFFLCFALWSRRTRPLAILVGCGFHLQIAFLMDIPEFSVAMIASYLLFVAPIGSGGRPT